MNHFPSKDLGANSHDLHIYIKFKLTSIKIKYAVDTVYTLFMQFI